MSVGRHHRHTPHHHPYGGITRSGAQFAISAGRQVGRVVQNYVTPSRTPHRHPHGPPNQHRPAAEVRNQDATSNTVAEIQGGHKKVRTMKKKSIHVSSKFKKMVKKAEEGKAIHGTKIDIEYRKCPSVGLNQQGYQVWGPATNNLSRPGLEWSFLPEYFLDAASVLWYGKAASISYTMIDTTNIGDGIAPANTGATAFTNVEFDILDSWEEYLYKNNTNRGCTVTIYECAPKKKSNLTTAAQVWDTTAGVLNDVTSLQTPPTYWENALIDESTEGRNLGFVTPGFLDLDPTHSPTFNKGYSVTSHKVYLSPGASFAYKLQGPNNVNFSLTDHVVNTRIFDLAKYSRYVMNVVKWDLACTAGSAAANTITMSRLAYAPTQLVGVVSSATLPTPTLPVGEQLSFERKSYCKLRMPDITGGTGVAAGSKFALGYRRPCYSYNLWSSGVIATQVYGVTQQTFVEPTTGTTDVN
nr:MAG: capsid protein [Cressdnaviricota sp.]